MQKALKAGEGNPDGSSAAAVKEDTGSTKETRATNVASRVSNGHEPCVGESTGVHVGVALGCTGAVCAL